MTNPRMPQAHHAWPLDHYHDDMGPVLWYKLPIEEAPWCGTPNDSDWPGYHTHFQPLPPTPVAVDLSKTLHETFAELRAMWPKRASDELRAGIPSGASDELRDQMVAQGAWGRRWLKDGAMTDHIEAWANAIAGLGVSLLLVYALRWAGLWDAHALTLSSAFFMASVARSYALRRLFRWMEDAR